MPPHAADVKINASASRHKGQWMLHTQQTSGASKCLHTQQTSGASKCLHTQQTSGASECLHTQQTSGASQTPPHAADVRGNVECPSTRSRASGASKCLHTQQTSGPPRDGFSFVYLPACIAPLGHLPPPPAASATHLAACGLTGVACVARATRARVRAGSNILPTSAALSSSPPCVAAAAAGVPSWGRARLGTRLRLPAANAWHAACVWVQKVRRAKRGAGGWRRQQRGTLGGCCLV